jgi:hypothetical protein
MNDRHTLLVTDALKIKTCFVQGVLRKQDHRLTQNGLVYYLQQLVANLATTTHNLQHLITQHLINNIRP